MARTERPLNERQRLILCFIAEQLGASGYPPTIREIGTEVGISSTSVVNYHLNKLKERGLLERDDRVSRGLKLTQAAGEYVDLPGMVPREVGISGHGGLFRLPVLGQIAAGQPISVPDDPDPEDYIEVSSDMVGAREEVFALHVKGSSMIDALINDGDIVVLQQTDTAENGEMVAAWIEDREETTLKRFYREDGMIRLQPANPTMGPIFEQDSNVRIQGRVIAVIRSVA
jgi:repressor LexA